MFGISISGGLDVDGNFYYGKSTFFSRLKVKRFRFGLYLEITFLNSLTTVIVNHLYLCKTERCLKFKCLSYFAKLKS